MNQEKHVLQLDGLRFFAVLMVMIAHWLQWQWTNPVLLNFFFVRGVTLFFVLSGFLITRILLNNRDQSSIKNAGRGIIYRFYLRRALRIFPIYYLLLFGLWIINFKETREVFIWLVSYTSNIYQGNHNRLIDGLGHF